MQKQINLSHNDIVTLCFVVRELLICLMDSKTDEDRAFLCYSAFYLCKDKLLLVLDPKKDARIIRFYTEHGLSKYHNVLKFKRLKDREMEQGTIKEWKEELEPLPGKYGRIITNGILSMGKAVECALNVRDTATIAELRKLCDDVFEQAEQALNEVESKESVQ